MNDDELITSIINSSQLSNTILICNVCGGERAQKHYGALCCFSCKMFFRRNSHLDLTNRTCVFKEKCLITTNNRRSCRFCRLEKCLAIGMQKELLRASFARPEFPKRRSIEKSLPMLDLVTNDRSLLTNEQWCYLNNIIDLYNSKSPVANIRQLLAVQSKLPLKLRLKMAPLTILQVIESMYQALFPFIETLPEYRTLDRKDRCLLIERNLSYVGAFNGIIIFRDAEVTLSTAFKNGLPSIYGSQISDTAVQVALRTERDLTLIKLFIPILFFSTTFNINDRHFYNSDNILFNSRRLFSIQNLYLEVMFKYMIYRFGYEEASLRFAALIKNVLDQSMCLLKAEDVQLHDQFVGTIVKETQSQQAT